MLLPFHCHLCSARPAFQLLEPGNCRAVAWLTPLPLAALLDLLLEKGVACPAGLNTGLLLLLLLVLVLVLAVVLLTGWWSVALQGRGSRWCLGIGMTGKLV